MATDDDCERSLALYQVEDIKSLERTACVTDAITEADMMQEAGAFAFKVLKLTWPDARKLAVVCGRGNNAGDGFVLALLAHLESFDVTCYHLFDLESVKKGPAFECASVCVDAGVPMVRFSGELQECDVVVDALLGTGMQGELKSPFIEACDKINLLNNVLSLDVPSGLNANTGVACHHSVVADVTCEFIGRKQGLYTRQGPKHAGIRQLSDLGLTNGVFAKVPARGQWLSDGVIRRLLPKRPIDCHKGRFGHVLVVGGDYGMGGAVRMAAEAAMRVGAGLVSVATRPEHVNIVSGSRPEIMCHHVTELCDIEPLVERASVLVLGPGLGQSEWSRDLFDYLITKKIPTVLDADALNLLSEKPVCRDHWILTPHPGEAGRLLKQTCNDVQTDRFKAVREIQKQYGGVCVLKGAGTLIQDDNDLNVCVHGNPGMATGGMGDILSGVIGGLLAQHLSLYDAACTGVFVHSKAADQAAFDGGERGLLATDLLNYLREMVNVD